MSLVGDKKDFSKKFLKIKGILARFPQRIRFSLDLFSTPKGSKVNNYDNYVVITVI